MLINTVLLFLQSVLPMFVIISLLLSCFTSQTVTQITRANVIFISGLAIAFALILHQCMERISVSFGGKGSELLFSSGFILIYFCSVLLFLLSSKNNFSNVTKILALIVFLLVFSLNGSHFMFYLTSHWTQGKSGVEPLLIGIILAIGICVSVAILLYFLLGYSNKNIHIKTSRYFLLFFSLGQLIQSIALLQQVDVLPLSYSLWNSNHFITENSEIGQLLGVMFGYETTPSLMQLIIYLAAFILPVFISHSRYFNRLTSGEKS